MAALVSPAERPPIIRADFANEYVMLPQERIDCRAEKLGAETVDHALAAQIGQFRGFSPT